MTTLDQHLRKIYFEPSHPAFMSGPRKLMRLVKNDGFHPTYSYIRQWVNDQEAYSLHRQSRKKFKRARVIVSGAEDMYDTDLADMMELAEENDDVHFLLVVIDVFSKRLAVRPLKDKTAKSVKNALDTVFSSKFMPPPKLLRSDAGKEFNNNTIKRYLNEKDIKYQIARNEGKAHFAERVIRTLKGKIWRYLTHNNTKRYVDKLQDLVKGYNRSVHRSTKRKPKDINKENSKKLWWSIYRPKSTKIAKRGFKFKPGDYVRVSYLKNKFTRDFDQQWTREVFIVAEKFRLDGVPVYRLKDYNGEAITGTFYTQELQKIHPEDIWKVEKVLRTRKRGGKTQYYVRWLGWGPNFDSWVDSVESL